MYRAYFLLRILQYEPLIVNLSCLSLGIRRLGQISCGESRYSVHFWRTYRTQLFLSIVLPYLCIILTSSSIAGSIGIVVHEPERYRGDTVYLLPLDGESWPQGAGILRSRGKEAFASPHAGKPTRAHLFAEWTHVLIMFPEIQKARMGITNFFIKEGQ